MSSVPSPNSLGAPANVEAPAGAARPRSLRSVQSQVRRVSSAAGCVVDRISSGASKARRDYRTKALVLSLFESLAVLGIIIASDYVTTPGWDHGAATMFGVLIAIMLVLVAFWCVRQIYPVNYIYLSAITLMAEVFWGMADKFAFQHELDLPMQMGLIMVVLQAAWLICMQVRCEDDCRPIVGGAFLGFLAGAGVNAVVVAMRNPPLFALALSSFAMMLCTLAMISMVAENMARCRTDRYMEVAFWLTISLLFVVSVPLAAALRGFGVNCHAVEGGTSDSGRPKRNDGEQHLEEQPRLTSV